MKVKMTESIRGSVGGHWSPNKGDELDVDDNIGAKLCARGVAKPIAESEDVETRRERPADTANPNAAADALGTPEHKGQDATPADEADPKEQDPHPVEKKPLAPPEDGRVPDEATDNPPRSRVAREDDGEPKTAPPTKATAEAKAAADKADDKAEKPARKRAPRKTAARKTTGA